MGEGSTESDALFDYHISHISIVVVVVGGGCVVDVAVFVNFKIWLLLLLLLLLFIVIYHEPVAKQQPPAHHDLGHQQPQALVFSGTTSPAGSFPHNY